MISNFREDRFWLTLMGQVLRCEPLSCALLGQQHVRFMWHFYCNHVNVRCKLRRIAGSDAGFSHTEHTKRHFLCQEEIAISNGQTCWIFDKPVGWFSFKDADRRYIIEFPHSAQTGYPVRKLECKMMCNCFNYKN
uniref:Uncharacterized protein n=1 Tax=Molossus molossus TaxID=27622 RepID=A0A7J8J142_MOLMO|nr:hypothetical protein HJG59_010421 [Molossus molossus]